MNFILFLCFAILFFIFIFSKKKNKLYLDESQNNKTNINDEFIVPNLEQNNEIKETNEQNLDSKYNHNVIRGKDGRYKSLKK
jgi:hypothetical protein